MFFRKKNGDRRGRIGFIYFSLLELSVCNFCFLTMWISFLIKWMNKLINSFFRSFFRITVSTIQFSSVTQSCPTLVTPWTSLSITNSWSLHKLMSIESVIPSNHLILGRSLLLLPSILVSIKVFSNESALSMRWPKYWSFNFSISPSNEQSGLISFRMDWLDLLAVQGSLFQHHSSKASILRHSAFFTVQLSHPYMTTGKTIALTRRTFVDKVMSYFLICCLGWS